MIIIDMHLDLAMNALGWNRDLKLPVAEMRRLEEGMPEKGRAASMVALPELRQAKVAVASATLNARVMRPNSPVSGYRDHDIAYGAAQGQLAYYRQLAAQGNVTIITNLRELDRHIEAWQVAEQAGTEPPPLGIIISMEGADAIVSPEQVPQWWRDGLRIVSLVHYGVSKYAHGTGTHGPLTDDGRALLPALEQAGMILDVTHLCDESFDEALDLFGGPVLASHQNCRALVPGERQFSDDQLRRVIARGGVIGVAMDAWMLYPGWIKGVTRNEVVSLQAWGDHVDHICQLAGDALHVAVGTDLDGGYGYEQCPHDLESVAGLQKLPGLLAARGYRDEDVRAIMYGNWLRLLRSAWAK